MSTNDRTCGSTRLWTRGQRNITSSGGSQYSSDCHRRRRTVVKQLLDRHIHALQADGSACGFETRQLSGSTLRGLLYAPLAMP